MCWVKTDFACRSSADLAVRNDHRDQFRLWPFATPSPKGRRRQEVRASPPRADHGDPRDAPASAGARPEDPRGVGVPELTSKSKQIQIQSQSLSEVMENPVYIKCLQ